MARRKQGKQVGNTYQVPMTWKSLLGAKHFGRGFREVKNGRPWNDDGGEWGNAFRHHDSDRERFGADY